MLELPSLSTLISGRELLLDTSDVLALAGTLLGAILTFFKFIWKSLSTLPEFIRDLPTDQWTEHVMPRSREALPF